MIPDMWIITTFLLSFLFGVPAVAGYIFTKGILKSKSRRIIFAVILSSFPMAVAGFYNFFNPCYTPCIGCETSLSWILTSIISVLPIYFLILLIIKYTEKNKMSIEEIDRTFSKGAVH